MVQLHVHLHQRLLYVLDVSLRWRIQPCELSSDSARLLLFCSRQWKEWTSQHFGAVREAHNTFETQALHPCKGIS